MNSHATMDREQDTAEDAVAYIRDVLSFLGLTEDDLEQVQTFASEARFAGLTNRQAAVYVLRQMGADETFVAAFEQRINR